MRAVRFLEMKPDAIHDVITELRPLLGGRVQKIDRVDDRSVVFAIRVPGRTLLLLVSADLGRVHLVDERPPRTVPGGSTQRTLRERLEGKPLIDLAYDGRAVRIDVGDGGLEIDLAGRKNPFRFLPPSGRAMPEPGPVPDRFPLSEQRAVELDRIGPTEAENRLKASLLSGLLKREKKLQRLAQNLTGDRDKLARMEAEGGHGERLKSMLHRVPKGARAIEAADWSTGAPVTVRLDPALSAKANMERYFARAKKAARGSPIVSRRLAEVTAQLDDIAREKARIGDATGDALQQLAARSASASERIEAERGEKSEKKKPIDRWSRRFIAKDGSEIRVGRGAAENDRLTLNGARGHDLWLHARGTAGAHVVLRTEKGRSPDLEAVLDAAHLAAFYSSAKNDAKVEVITTEARYVRKTKGDPPGRVSVARGKTILIAMDPARLDRLLGRTVGREP